MFARTLLGIICVLTLRPDQPPQGPAKCEMLKTRHLAVNVKINGQGPYRLIFDTGSPVVLINTRIAKECKLFGAKTSALAGWPGQVTLSSVEVSGVKAADVPAVVFDHPTVKAIEGVVGPIDGILGHPYFARFATTVDYPARTITFVPSVYKPKDAMETIMQAMFDKSQTKKVHVIAPSGQWGLEVAKADDDRADGVTVRKVLIESAASVAGLLEGDRLLAIDGRWTDSVDDCIRAVAGLEAGKPYQIAIVRGGKAMQLSVTPKAGS